jgi:hypothetical protein
VSTSEEQWNELEAVLLLQRAGRLVQEIESSGTRMLHSDRKLYHARLVAAHDAQDMAAYRIALEGYVEGARMSYRKATGRQQKREEG